MSPRAGTLADIQTAPYLYALTNILTIQPVEMKTKLNLLLFAALSALVFSSCKRTDYANEVDPQLMGAWKLVSTSVRTTAEVTLDNLRTVTITDYVTENNKGTITFETNKSYRKKYLLRHQLNDFREDL